MPCAQKRLPRIDVLFGGYWMEILVKDYLIPIETASPMCFICFFPENELDRWLLGDSFLRGYYSVYDYERRKMGFAPHKESTKSAPTKGNAPTENLNDALEWWAILLIVLAACSGLAVIIWLIVISGNTTSPTKEISVFILNN